MSKCTCGRTTRSPFCDGSHRLTEDQYRERTERLKKFFAATKKMIETVQEEKTESITSVTSSTHYK